MHVCTYVCKQECQYGFADVWMYGCTYVICMYDCLHACMHSCMHLCMYGYIQTTAREVGVWELGRPHMLEALESRLMLLIELCPTS